MRAMCYGMWRVCDRVCVTIVGSGVEEGTATT